MKIVRQGKVPEWLGQKVPCSNCHCEFVIQQDNEVEIQYKPKSYDAYDYSELDSGYIGAYYKVVKYIKVICPNCNEKITISEEIVAKGLSKKNAEDFIQKKC